MTVSNADSIGAYEAKTRFSELLEKVAAGGEVTITKHGVPVARLVPFRNKATPEARRAAIERWLASSAGIRLANLKLRDLINEGRP